MTTRLTPHAAASISRDPARAMSAIHADDDWRCPRCTKLLGRIRAGHLHVRFARAHEYITALPASCTCRGCRTLSRRDR